MRRERTRGGTPAFARAVATAVLLLPLAVAAAACDGPATSSRQTPPPVRIGAIYSLTGGQAAVDAPSLDGARLAVDRINAHGGLLGRRVELLERDGQMSEKAVSRAAASLVASGCSAIIGLSDSRQVLAAAPIAARAGVPFVTSGATSPRLTGEVPDWLFLACFGDNTQAAANAQYATEQLGARTVALLYDRRLDSTRLLARYFERSFRAQGGNVFVTADYGEPAEAVRRLADGAVEPKSKTDSGEESGSGAQSDAGGESTSETQEATADGQETSADGQETSADGQEASADGQVASGEDGSGSQDAQSEPSEPAEPAEASGPPRAMQADVLFVAAAPEDAARLVRKLRAAGYRQPIMGGHSFDSDELVDAAEKTGGKVYFTTHAAVGLSSASRAVRRFDAFYHAAYGRPPQNAFAGLGYDAVGLVASAIRRADSVKPSAIRDSLQATRHYAGVTGTLGYARDERVPHKKVTMVCVGRRPVVVAQFTPGYVAEP